MSLEIFLSDIVNVIWILISIFGVSMAFKTSVSDNPIRRRRWFRSLAILAIVGFLASHFDKALNARTQTELQGKLDTSIGNEGRLEGKLGLISETVSKFNCPGAQEFAAAIRQAIPSQKNQPGAALSNVQSTIPPESPQSHESDTAKLKDDVAAFTKRLRESEAIYLEEVAKMKDSSHIYSYQGRDLFQSTYTNDFRTNYRAQAIELRDKLLRLLNQPVTFMAAIDQDSRAWSLGDRQLGELADYLDGLASQLK